MYFYLKPGNPPLWQSKNLTIILGAIFMFFEALNFQTHLILRNLRRPGTTERKIPVGCGFGLVSCANYFWETSAWLVFAIFA